MFPVPRMSSGGLTRLIVRRDDDAGVTIATEYHENGHERAFWKRDGKAEISVAYGPRGAWRRAEVNEVPDDIWYLLIDGRLGID